MAYTFKGGIRLEKNNSTAKLHTEAVSDAPYVKLLLKHGADSPAKLTVKERDTVKLGQVIGEETVGASACPVHASVSGKVTSAEEYITADGTVYTAVVIENDLQHTLSESVTPCTQSISKMSREEIIERIRLAGITDTDAGSCPAYEKISRAVGKAEYLIVNCTECDHLTASTHRLLLEEPKRVIGGVKILLRAIGAPKAYIAIESGKKDVIRKLQKLLANQDIISVKAMKPKYPQGDERQLVFALTGRELASGKLPTDAGCVVFGAAACAAVYTAFSEGLPLVKRYVTVSGDCVKTPKNLSVPIGTPVSHLIKLCAGLVKAPEKMIFGGIMAGKAQVSADTPTDKSTLSVLLLSEEYSKGSRSPAVCIRCGRCIRVCPAGLMPSHVAAFTANGSFDAAEKYGVMSCTECGACAYACPGKVDLVSRIREAKAHILAEADKGDDPVSEKE